MKNHSIRLALRQHTQDVHRQLDAAVGVLGDLGGYGAFLVNSFRFRRMIEPGLDRAGSWRPQSLLPELRLDLADLSLPLPPAEPGPPGQPAGESARIGALYVLEGSALGARLLFERARSLGLSGQRGARHLARQVAEPGRWRDFVEFIETRRDLEPAAVLAGARSAFETAFALYSGAR